MMTFEEWWANCPADESARDAAHDAWDYATKQATAAERERCAKVCEKMAAEVANFPNLKPHPADPVLLAARRIRTGHTD